MFKSKKKKIQGPEFPYSHGDHVTRMLLGPVFDRWNELDEIIFQ